MRRALKILCVSAAMAASAPAWADLVTLSAFGNSDKSDWSVTFNSADTTLTFDEIVAGSFTGTTYTVSQGSTITYNILDQIAGGIGTLNFGGSDYTVDGNDITDSFCTDGTWCFSQSAGSNKVSSVVSTWQYRIAGVDDGNTVPEPGSLALLALGLAGLGLSRRRKAA